MSRLFITAREMNFISDITKELIKDVCGQKVFYYPISENKTQVDDVYNEAVRKVFDAPIILDALVDSNFQSDTKIDMHGVDPQFKIEVFLQYRDLVDKGITPAIGDFFSFSDVLYEVAERVNMRNIYGQAEHKDGVKLIGTKARQTQFNTPIIGPTDIARPETDAVQTTFYQQRGQVVNGDGVTGDVRDLQKPTVLDVPITGAKEVSPRGDQASSGASAFYDESDDA
jgi:hypothetical protein